MAVDDSIVQFVHILEQVLCVFPVLNHLSNGSSGEIQNLQNIEQCYPLQKRMKFKLTSQQVVAFTVLGLFFCYKLASFSNTKKNSMQITPGVYYIGLFNGIGPIRTQSKMVYF